LSESLMRQCSGGRWGRRLVCKTFRLRYRRRCRSRGIWRKPGAVSDERYRSTD
jgi:hypothetical protein